MASADLPLGWAQRFNVLRSFSDAMKTRATMINWNRPDSRNRRPLDLLNDSSVGADANDGAVILRMSDLMLKNGGSCVAGEWPYFPVCAGSLGRALADILDREAPDGAAAAAAWRAIEDAGLDPNLAGGGERPILTDAGLARRAAAVSILIALGADLDDLPNGGFMRAIADSINRNNAPEFLEVTRHFFGGLHAAGLTDFYDGWNLGERPLLEHLSDDHGPAPFEIAALLYERGARCGPDARARVCGLPVESGLIRVGGNEIGWSTTLYARDFAGAVFSMPLPDAGNLAALASIGLTLRANAAASPDELILSRSVAGVVGGSAVFTVTMMNANNQAAREFRVRAETARPLLASLWNAAREGDAARTKSALDGLDPEHADAADRDGITPLLIVAATLGHAEVVSVLVAAGADPDARHPSSFNRGIPHLMASAGPPHSLAEKLAVLRSFSGALSARATVLDWNQQDSRNKPPLDLLNETYEGADEGRRAVLLQMSEEMLKNGATCKDDEWPYPTACVGALGRALVDSLDRESPDVAAVSVALRAVTDAGIDPTLLGSRLWPFLVGMAVTGRAAALSVAIVAGVDPNVKPGRGDVLNEIAYNTYEGIEPLMLAVLRHFLGGLHIAGLNDSYNGWNYGSSRPLESVDYGSPESLEIAALLYERGSRCGAVNFKKVCRIPIEERAATVTAGDLEWTLTLTARDFAGAVFTLPLPDADKLAELEAAGLTLRTKTGAGADEVIVSLARESARVGAVFTITMMNAAGQPSREFRVRVGIAGSLLPLLDDAVRTGDAERARSLLAALEPADVSAPDGDGIAPLVTAATLGHAEVVSVLVVGGADPAARNPRFHDGAIPHMMSAFDFPLARDAQWEVLKHFGDAVEARATVFDWNLSDRSGNLPLDLLPRAEAEAASDDERVVILRMSDYMIKRGAFCQSGLEDARKYHGTCVGSRGAALAATITGPTAPDDDALRAALLAALESGVDLDRVGTPTEGSVLPAAALLRRAHAVSILLTAGLDPGALSKGRAVLHHVGEQSGLYAPDMLDVLRHFIGGLHVAGRARSFDGWNQLEGVNRPLSALANSATSEAIAERREIAALLHERGARCIGADLSSYCQIPVERRYAQIGVNEADWALTLTARDFGGAVFSLSPPDAGKAAELEARGWSLRVDAAAAPDEAVLSRTRLGEESEAAVFTVTMVSARGEAAREFQVRAQIVPPLLASLQAAARAGDAARTEFLLSQPGPSRANAVDRDGITPLLIVAATLGHAEVVSVLVAAGADPDARAPSLFNRGVAHLAASDDLSPSWAQKSEVLRHFIGAMKTRATVLNWNQPDGLGRWPLDFLRDGFDNASKDDQEIILRMSDQMLQGGAFCRTGSWPYNPACLGSYGFALAELLGRPERAADSEVVAATRAITMGGIFPTVLGSAEDPFLPEAAKRGHAAAVSILIVVGADPTVEYARGHNILHVIAGNSGESSSAALETARHFIGGLHAAGLAGSFDGWNAGAEPALNLVDRGHSGDDAAIGWEIAALLYERGARCGGGEIGPHCDVPIERHMKRFVGVDVGVALTLTARDFGGATFALRPPDSGKLAELEAIGLTLRTNTEADPDEAILSLWRESPAGGAAVFTVTMADAGNRAAREFQVSADIATPLLASLWDAAREGDAARTKSALDGLDPEHADAADRDGITPLLIVAATLGHAEVVSVLVVAGANPDPVWRGGAFGGVPHLMASADLPLGWAQRFNVLRSFSDAIETRATMINWNRPDSRNRRPLDLLNDSSVGADANDGAVILRMSDLMLKNGGSCVAGEWPYFPVCAGSLGRALADILDREAPDGAAAAAAWRAIEDAGLDPNLAGGGERPILTDAGLARRAAAVSILIALGADLDDLPNGGFMRAIADSINRNNAPEFLEVTRHFFGGLHAAGLTDFYDGWNLGERPLLEHLSDDHGPAPFEIAALLYERGARCRYDARARVCGLPVESGLIRVGGNEIGWSTTLYARDFAGAVFSMPLPDAGNLAALASIGLTLRANAAASPDELILSRSVAGVVGGSAVFTVTMMNANNQAAREFRVRAETARPLLASLWNAAREGDAARTKSALDGLDPEHADAADRDGITPLLIVAATLGHAEVVSVLVAAGADPDARHPSSFNRGIPHLMASAGPPHSLAEKLAVLRSFSGALSARATVLDWNQQDSRNKLPLDLLNEAYEGADEGRRAVLLQMSGEMLKNGATCRDDEWPYPIACVGALGRALVDSLDRESPDVAAVSVALRAVTDAGIDPTLLGSRLWPFLVGMAVTGRASALSVAIVAGVDPNVKPGRGDVLNEIAYNTYEGMEPLMLAVLRHFLGGLHIAGLNDSYNGWNYGSSRPLDSVRGDAPESLEIAALLYERGARCGAVNFKKACQIPIEERAATVTAGDLEWTLTLTARDFAGAVFTLPLPDADKLAELEAAGLTLRANTTADADEMIVSLARESAWGGTAFTVTMMNAAGQPSREFRVRTEIAGSLLPLLDDAVRTGDAERARSLLAALEPADVSAPDGDGIAPLVAAATLGHAEVVSVLVVGGADPAARNPRFHDGAIPHMMSAFDFPLARDAQWEVLKHFGDAVEARATVFDWNLSDRSGNLPLDLLPRAEAEAASDDERVVILRMSDYMIKRGAFCQSSLEDARKYHGTCVGSRGAALAAMITGPTAPDDDGLRAALLAASESGVDLDRVGTPAEGSVLPAAALLRRAHAVSILLTAGLDPGALSKGRAVLHHVGEQSGLYAPDMLDVLRHFIGGLHVAGRARSFDGWNDLSGAARPLDALSRHARPGARTAGASVMEIHALLHERGARCSPPARGEYCGVPVEDRFARIGGDDIDWSLTLTARDFSGAVFTLPQPDAGKRAELAGFGLTLRTNTAADPDEMTASLASPSSPGGDAVFTVTMMSAAGQPAREFRVRAEIAPLPLASLWAAVRSGDAARTKSALAAMGPAHANAVDREGVPLLVVAATLGHAEVVSVLVAAKADPNVRHSSRFNRRIPHLLSAKDLPLSLEKKLKVLRSFIGATEALATVVNWNEEDDGGRNPLELLEESSRDADANDRAVVLQMSDAMMRKGAACRFGGWPYSPACLGSEGLALAELLGRTEAPDVAQVRAAMRAMTDAGLDPNATGGAAEPILLGLAATGRAAAVSVFIAAGADPEVSAGDRNLLHSLAEDSGRGAQAALDMLRYFIGGLSAAGRAGSFDGWNAADETPLGYFARNRSDGPAEREVAALMYERGARCGRGAGRALCRVPVEERLALVGGDDIGRVLTLTARDFGGAVFTLPQPDAGKLAEMAGAGFTLLADTATNPDEAVLSRLRASPGGEAAVFTVTMMSARGEATREFRVRAETTAPLLPSLRAAVRSGDVEAARTLLAMLGGGRANEQDGGAPLLAVAAALGHAKMVSVLITAGADPNGRHPSFKDFTIPHLLTGDDLTLSGEVKWETLRSFGDAVEARATVFDWNQPDGDGAPPLESLPAWFDRSGDAEEREIILRATDYMLMRGARCRAKVKNALRFHSACVGTLGGALAAMLIRAQAPDEQEMRNALQAMKNAGIPLGVAGLPEHGHILPIVAGMGRAAAVSILLAAGADPGEKSDGRNVPHHAAWKSAEDASEMLEVVRGFIGGIGGGGAGNALGVRTAKRFNGWNERDGGGNLPLDLLASRADPTDLAALELRALMYERGARCENPEGGVLCETPEEWRTSDAAVDESYAGDVMTIAARNFGDAVFSLELTDANEIPLLEDSGWQVESRTDSGGAKLVLLRTRARRQGDLSARFSAAARADGVDARVYKISACFVGESEMGGLCVPAAGNFEGIPQESLCGAYGGKRNAAGGGAICSGMDVNGTFCIEDSQKAFPCRGLFKHMRACNMKYNRRALNLLLCGAKCAAGEKAKGARCCDAELLKFGMCVESGE